MQCHRSTVPQIAVFMVQVTAIYIWNIISYDIQGVHYMSTNNQGSYRDDYVSGLITSYNQGIRGN